MAVRVKRTFELGVPDERVWEFIADPAKRAGAISVVDRFDVSDNGHHTTWYLEPSIPFVCSTVTVEMEDIEVDEPIHVKFVGKSRVMRVTGEHVIEEYDGGSRLVNEFTVDGWLSGVEALFKRNLDRELDNLGTELRHEFEAIA